MKTCLVCDTEINVARTYCRDCLPVVNQIQSRACQEVLKAKLTPAHTLECVDCKAPAYGYDHRAYSMPLDVVPVCVSCNHKRGPASDVRELSRLALGLDGTTPTYIPKQVRPKRERPLMVDLVGLLDYEERTEILKSLEKTRYNQTEAAKLLGITFRSLRYRIDRLNIEWR